MTRTAIIVSPLFAVFGKRHTLSSYKEDFIPRQEAFKLKQRIPASIAGCMLTARLVCTMTLPVTGNELTRISNRVGFSSGRFGSWLSAFSFVFPLFDFVYMGSSLPSLSGGGLMFY